MRDAFHEQLDSITTQLVDMTRLAGSAMARATTALLDADLHLAEDVITGDRTLDHAREHLDGLAIDVLARQQPVATDLRTVVTALRMSGEPDNFLQGKVNPEEIGAAGHSLGGITVYEATFDDCCLDRRIDAAIVMDGAHPDIGDGFDLARGTPLLIMHADGDYRLPYAGAQSAFAAASPPKYFVTIHEVVHFEPFEDAPDPADQMVLDTTTAFWRLYLSHDADAAVDLSNSARVDGLTTVVEQPG